ncbi:hypothetical protein [Cryptosporangium aurantiacum]|uniref:Major Facilitator Superfamily protein n=1 Tax=Cryptosporangium aurantiacum TaxID=134849 RepID=A0A1M7PPH9_9ACTN|nr:hypothetical protein [Cryptosporangium aurantiacum]SHN19244.1 hypothetical protein SAMN05443668_103558 [Cryptosporangium aurantiacum]
MAIWVKDLTGSNGAAGLVLAWVAFWPLARPLLLRIVERAPRGSLVAANLVSALALVPLLTVRNADQLWLIHTAGAVCGLTAVVRLDALRTLALLVPLPDRGRVLGAFAATTVATGSIAAPLVGGTLYSVVGGGGVAVLSMVVSVCAAALCGLWRVTAEPREARTPSVVRKLGSGLRWLWRTRQQRHVIIGTSVVFLVTGPFQAVLFAIVELLGAPPEYVGVLVAVQGVGLAAGGIVGGRGVGAWGGLRVLQAGLVVFGSGVGVLFVPHLAAIAVGTMLVGIGLSMITTGSSVTAYSASGHAEPSQALLAVQWIGSAPRAVSAGAGAVLVAFIDYRVLFGVMAVGALVGLCYVLIMAGPRPVTGLISIARRSGLAVSLAQIADVIAGQRRTGGFAAWQADLAGRPEDGRPLSTRAQRRYAIGLIRAAIRMRLDDLIAVAWRPVEWLIKSDGRVFGLTLVAGAVMAQDFFARGGLSNLYGNCDNLFALGAGAAATTIALRKYRGITPNPSKAKRRNDPGR